MSVDCRELATAAGCMVRAGVAMPVVIHYEYREAADGSTVLYATRYTDAAGVPITPLVGDVFTPGQCETVGEFDSLILCAPVTFTKVVVVVSYDVTGVPTSHAYNLDGTPYGGAISALVQCPDNDTSSMAEPMCDNGATSFLRWFIIQNGVPTGVHFDTTVAGAPYVTVGTVTYGACGTGGPLATEATLAAVLMALGPLATQTTLVAVLAALGPLSTQATSVAILAALVAATPAGTNIIGKVAIDQTTPGTTDSVSLKSGASAMGITNPLLAEAPQFEVAGIAMARPADTNAYAALDSISNNVTAASVTANSVTISDTNDEPCNFAQVLLNAGDSGCAGKQVRLYLFKNDPTAASGVINGDNAAWSNKTAGWLGSFTGVMVGFSDGCRGVLTPESGAPSIMAKPTAGAKTYFWQLQTLEAFTPQSGSTWTPTFKGFQGRKTS